jgi:uncharacterized protein YqeY
MDFQSQIDQDIKEAMKAREVERLSVLRMLKSALMNAAIEKGGAGTKLEDAAAIAVVRREMKKRQDAVEGFEKGNRPELAAKERAEAEILSAYLPKALGEAEVTELVNECIEAVGATSKAQMGAVMKLANERAAGRIEGKVLSAAVSSQLS